MAKYLVNLKGAPPLNIYNVPTIYMQKENFQSDLDSGFVNKYNK